MTQFPYTPDDEHGRKIQRAWLRNKWNRDADLILEWERRQVASVFVAWVKEQTCNTENRTES